MIIMMEVVIDVGMRAMDAMRITLTDMMMMMMVVVVSIVLTVVVRQGRALTRK